MPKSEENDPLLEDLLRAAPNARDAALQELFASHAMPLVDHLIETWVARGGLARGDVADVRGDVAVRLMRRLRQLIDHSGTKGIARLDDYIDATVHHSLHDHERRRHPLRSRLANRVRYVLTHTEGIEIWGRGPLVCGLGSWRNRADVVAVVPPTYVAGVATDDVRELRRAAVDILKRSGGPVAFDDLVGCLAVSLPVAAEEFLPASSAGPRADFPNPLSRLEGRQYVGLLWAEITQLPIRQRRALLLQLHLEDGESVARLLPVLRVADVRTLAATLEMPLAELLALWNELPLMDKRIAGLLGVSRQQVINLRKSARERLSRRMERCADRRKERTSA